MLADEEWPVEEDDEGLDSAINKTMTFEEFKLKATEMIERAEEEIAETKEIMSVSPGSNAEYDVDTIRDRDSSYSPVLLPARRNAVDEPEPLYDQTRLDPISQLWGAPPDVLERDLDDDDSEQLLINDGVDFSKVYSMWGEDVPIEALDEEEVVTSSPSMDGFSQLWNEDLSPYRGDENDGDYNDEEIDSAMRTVNYGAYAGLDWWDEVSEDGKEVRLSQMLADEEYEEAIEPEEEAPMTFEQFAEETEKLIEQAEDERKETEAIMNAPPNANFLEADEDIEDSAVEKSIVSSDKFEEMILSLAEEEGNEIITDEDIDVLEMDDFPEEEEELERKSSSSSDVEGDIPLEIPDEIAEPINGND